MLSTWKFMWQSPGWSPRKTASLWCTGSIRIRQAANPVTPLSAAEIASWRAVGGELLPRLWQHLRHRCGAGPGAGEEQG